MITNTCDYFCKWNQLPVVAIMSYDYPIHVCYLYLKLLFNTSCPNTHKTDRSVKWNSIIIFCWQKLSKRTNLIHIQSRLLYTWVGDLFQKELYQMFTIREVIIMSFDYAVYIPLCVKICVTVPVLYTYWLSFLHTFVFGDMFGDMCWSVHARYMLTELSTYRCVCVEVCVLDT